MKWVKRMLYIDFLDNLSAVENSNDDLWTGHFQHVITHRGNSHGQSQVLTWQHSAVQQVRCEHQYMTPDTVCTAALVGSSAAATSKTNKYLDDLNTGATDVTKHSMLWLPQSLYLLTITFPHSKTYLFTVSFLPCPMVLQLALLYLLLSIFIHMTL